MKKVLSGKKGQGMTEYILIIALIAIVVVASVKLFGKKVDKGFQNAASSVENAVGK
jgi:Flp pilus assembly pilin Flp